ncbi:hypothetical protein QUC31_008296 [Theobroma cacao]
MNGSGEVANTYENMWDLTPDTDLLMELPEEYTFETALADLIARLLFYSFNRTIPCISMVECVNVLENTISSFDTGPGMDGSDENSIVKCVVTLCGKMGASLNRLCKVQAIGCKPPYLMLEALFCDNAALFGHVWIWRTYGIYASRETDGGIRDASEDEIRNLLMRALQSVMSCPTLPGLLHLLSFRAAITNLLSCSGPEFTILLHFSLKRENVATKGSKASEGTNARLKCIYFPIHQGKENIERILEKLDAEGCGVGDNYENFSCIPISCLGRLLPDARWCGVLLGGEPQDLIYNIPASLKALLPFMDLRQHKGDKSHLLKRCYLRVKCSVSSVQNL